MAARVAAIKAWRRGADPARAIYDVMAKAAPLLAQTMTAAHLRGEARVLLNMPETRRRVRLDRSPLDDIIGRLADKLNASPQRVAYLTANYRLPAEQAIATATQDIIGTVRTAIEQATRERLHVGEGMALIREAFNTSGVTNAANFQLEALFRTGTGIGYGAGRWSQNQEPEIREILWGYRYVTAGDDRVRDSHKELDGLTMPVEDPRWATAFPPPPSSPWNCRCDTVEIFKDQTEDAVLVVPDGAFENLIGSASPFGSALQWAG